MKDVEAEETLTLRERERMGLTQVELAKMLGVTQPEIHRIENQDDLRVSTLRRYLHGLGLKLELVVVAAGDRYVLRDI